MKLYYAQATCSLAVHMALREAGLSFTLSKYDMKSGLLDDGRRLLEVNPKGFVPVLELDGGERLTEVSVVLQYIAEQNPASGLLPPAGSLARYRVQEWLNFIATEIHKAHWPIFHDGAELEVQKAHEKLARNYAWVEEQLGEKLYLTGEQCTVADLYLGVTLNWARAAKIDLARWPGLVALRDRVRARPAVQAAMEAEGLIKKKTA
jgi:glutathione S-transferase